jgi:acyl-CoA thioester hydrolase
MPVFTHSLRVTYADCTAGNHVYYSRYLDFLESTRGEFFRRLGKTFLEWQEQDTLFPVRECRIRYRLPARYDEVIRIDLRLTALEGARMGFGYRILNQAAAPVLEAETVHACTTIEGKLKRLPRQLIDLAGPYVDPAAHQIAGPASAGG